VFSENRNLYLYALGSSLLAVFLIYEAITFKKSYPKYDNLLFLEGKLSEVKYVRRTSHVPSSLRFSLSDIDDEFVYHSNSGAIIRVRDLMKAGSVAKVGYAEEGRRRKSIYDLEIDGSKVRSYKEITASQNSDHKWIYLLIPWMIFSAIYLFRAARRHRVINK